MICHRCRRKVPALYDDFLCARCTTGPIPLTPPSPAIRPRKRKPTSIPANTRTIRRETRRIPIDYPALEALTGIQSGQPCFLPAVGWVFRAPGRMREIEPPPLRLCETQVVIRDGHWVFLRPIPINWRRLPYTPSPLARRVNDQAHP